jgi:hypothetical protein
MRSPDQTGELDLDRDLPTTKEDVDALRKARRMSSLRGLRDINLLDARRYFPDIPRRRTVFPDMPPFEL